MATDNSDEIERLNESIRSLQVSLEGLTGTVNKAATGVAADTSKASKALADSAKVSEDAARKAQEGFKQFGGSLMNAGKETSKALMDTSAGLGKYSGAVSAFGGVVSTAAKGLGMLAGPVTLLVTVITKLVGSAIEFTDNVVKAHDSIADMGATIGTSTDDIINLGRKAGYSSETLGTLYKVAGQVGQELAVLGGSSSKGVKAFGEIAAISADQREKFRNLGFSQEQVTEMQGVFVKQLAQTGGTLAKTPKQLQEESVKYIKELNVLSELTGVSAKKQQEAMDKALANENFNAYLHKKERERDAELDPVKKANINAEIEKRKALAAVIVATEDTASATGKLQALSTANGDIITEQTASLEAGGQSMRELVASTKDSTKSAGEIVLKNFDSVGKSVRNFEDKVGEAGYAYGQSSIEFQKAMGQSNEARKIETQIRNMSVEDQKKFVDETIKKQNDKEKKGDTILDARNAAEETAIKGRLEFEKHLKEANEGILKVFTKFMDSLKDAIEWVGKFVDKFKSVLGFGSSSSSSSSSAAPSGGGAAAPAPAATSAVGMAAKGPTTRGLSKPGGGGASAGGGQESHEPAAPAGGGGAGGAPKLASIHTKSGKSTQVGEPYAGAFQSLIDNLEGTGYQINSLGGYVDRDVRGKPGVKSIHAHGAAIDINPGQNPLGSELVTDMPPDIAQIAAAAGLGWGGNWSSRKDAMHFSAATSEGGKLLKAKNGAITDGPMSGYLVEHHGEEITAPLNPNSLLKKLGETTMSEFQASMNNSSGNDATTALLQELVNTMGEKLDAVIEKLASGNETQEQILTYSMV